MTQNAETTANGYAVLELFTSEGCTSCPAAEALLPKLKAKYGANLFVLAYHVDYWNRKGWQDKFSDTTFSRRQESYANHFNPNNITVYTPQVIINGKTGVNGSNRSKIEELVDTELQLSPGKNITLTASVPQSGKLTVSYNTALASKEILYIALVLLDASTTVEAGANKGKRLSQIHIVRSLKTTKKGKGQMEFTIPPQTDPSDYHVIAFTQSTINYNVTGAEEIPANSTNVSQK
jgi:hypothetical protein